MLEMLSSGTTFVATDNEKIIKDDTTYILGFPFDGTTSFRSGTRFGPRAIREASLQIEDYSPYLDLDLADYSITDLGDLPLFPSRRDVMEQNFLSLWQDINIKEKNIKILTLGGEHSISITPISLYLKHFPDLVILHLDAHTDLRDGYLHDDFSHASVMRRVLDILPSDARLIQQGIRSGTKEEFNLMKEKDTLIKSLDNLLFFLQLVPDDVPIYLTLDLDYFDPSYCPAVGTPETGGENFYSLIKILKSLKDKNLVGADVVELSPMIDSTQNSNSFAALVVREILLALSHKK